MGKLRSLISIELVRQGYIKYSKEFKAAYMRELRKRPHIKEKDKILFKNWYNSKDLSFHSKRLKKWRLKNPEKWNSIMARCSQNGLHKRFYEKNKERLKPVKREQVKKYYKRKDPTYGLTRLTRKVKRGECTINELINECSTALIVANERSYKTKS